MLLLLVFGFGFGNVSNVKAQASQFLDGCSSLLGYSVTNGSLCDDTKDAYLIPAHLTIPSIDVSATIDQVGITQKGNMATSKNFNNVGWYKYGVMPGEIGSAVIAGHVNDGFALPGVFVNLKDLKNGDDIYVTTNNNTRLHFVMTSRKIYNYDAPTEEIFEDNSGKLLKLITCTGNWLTELGTHEQRIVVTAVLAS